MTSGNHGVWAITLWTAGRAPSLVGFAYGRVAASILGRLVLKRWAEVDQRFGDLLLDEFSILPDRMRCLVYAPSLRRLSRAVGWFKASVGREARQTAIDRERRVWEAGFDAYRIAGPEELASWRRRIGAGKALGLSGRNLAETRFRDRRPAAREGSPNGELPGPANQHPGFPIVGRPDAVKH